MARRSLRSVRQRALGALAQSVELQALRSTAVEDLAETVLAAGDAGAAVALLRPHLVKNPLDERPVGLIMRA